MISVLRLVSMKTINGQPVSEAQIDRWVTEAENGYDVETLRRRGRKPRNWRRLAGPTAFMMGAAVVWWLALPPRGWWVLFPVGVTMFMLALAGQPLRNRMWLGGLAGVAHYALALRWLTDFNTAGYAAVVAVQALLLMLVAAVSSLSLIHI